MLTLGSLAFAAPWVLLGLLTLPAIWWLLRVTPPLPRLVRFPPVRLLLGLRPPEETPARTPPWLIALRLLLAVLIVLALAHPLLDPGARLAGGGPVVVVVDDGWAAAPHWPDTERTLRDVLDQAGRDGRPVAMIPTARGPAVDAMAGLGGLRPAAEARSLAQALQPHPWSPDRARALAAVEALDLQAGEAVWLSDGLDHGAPEAVQALEQRLQRLGTLTRLAPPAGERARLLLPPEPDGARLAATARHLPAADAAAPVTLLAMDERGRVLARETVVPVPGSEQTAIPLELPTELRNRLARLEIDGEASAGAVVLLDERWRRRPVGLVAGGSVERAQPLLGDLYYLERALAPFGDLRYGEPAALTADGIAMLVLADVGRLPPAAEQAVGDWVARGGVLLRFAGPLLAQGVDSLVPVRLRIGERGLGGALTWGEPARLAPFEPDSPFAGLTLPGDVTVERQVLADPSPELADRSWARLADGTPLVTGVRQGEGWIVLFHVTPNANWSNLPLSGLFVDMLRRITQLSRGLAGEAASQPLPPLDVLDGYGRVQPAPATARPLPAGSRAAVGPDHPPGFYGTDESRLALNLGPTAAAPAALSPAPPGAIAGGYAASAERDLKPWLLVAALVLLLADIVIGLALRGFLPQPALRRPAVARREAGRRAAALILAVSLSAAAAGEARAQAGPGLGAGAGAGPAAASEAEALAATRQTRLAYVRTGVGPVDAASHAGLYGLSQMLTRRTSVEPADPLGIDIETDEILFFPLLYWPMVPEQAALSPMAMEKLARYMRTGGTVMFDTRDQGLGSDTVGPGTRRMRALLDGLNVPPLVPVPSDHVLTKAFYLLQEFPGRYAGGTVWVESAAEFVNDGVTPVIIAGNDFAAAWAMGADGLPLYPVTPGGEAQRETAYRFGINLVMYVLTGNYKADQVHVPAILERLGE